jgi:ribonuclease P/MRP protein subunit RPP40
VANARSEANVLRTSVAHITLVAVLWQNVAVLWEYVAMLWQNVAVLWEYVAMLWLNVAVLWLNVAVLWPFSFAMLKAVADVIMLPLLVIFQQSLSQGKFPSSWKKAKVVPVYKGKGERSLPSAYRPISLCSCVGKLLEKVVAEQLVKHIGVVKPLSVCQFGFQRGRSTVANLLACDASLIRYLDEGKSFDIFSFDFQRAFDKVPHDLLLESLDSLGLHATTFAWFSSFFQGRTQQVIMNGVASRTVEVTSGIVQGSVISPTCFCVFIDPLLHRIQELIGPRCFAYADDFKFVSGTSPADYTMAQTVISMINDWSTDHRMPLALDKSGVLHCGKDNPMLQYQLAGQPMLVMDHFKDLGVLRSPSARYDEHITSVAANCHRLCGALLHSFRTRDAQLLWMAFQSYVKPRLMYGSQVWSPTAQHSILTVERVQRRFATQIS